MFADRSSRCGAPGSARALALPLAATVFAALGSTAYRDAAAQEPPSTLQQLAKLERAFWVCDHAATTRGVDGDTGIVCVAVTEELKDEKFGGDFDKMLAWWRQHKRAVHAELDRRDQKLAGH
jgi:hypothetical protein